MASVPEQKTVSLEIVVAVSLKIIHDHQGFLPSTKDSKNNTQTKVLEYLPTADKTVINAYLPIAKKVIDFFATLDANKQLYASISSKGDSAMYQSCIDTAKLGTISNTNFPFAVIMPHLYGKLNPQYPKTENLNPNETKAKLAEPGQHLGTIGIPERFFFKLVGVGSFDKTRGTCMFRVIDRSNNVGFFATNPKRLSGKIELGDCFAMHCIPEAHKTDPDGQLHTIFRVADLIPNTTVPAKDKFDIDPSNDETKEKFFVPHKTVIDDEDDVPFN